MIGHRRAALVGDAVEQPDDIGAGNAADLAGAELRQHVALESAARRSPMLRSRLPSRVRYSSTMASSVSLSARSALTPRGQRVAAFGDGAKDGFGFPAGGSQCEAALSGACASTGRRRGTAPRSCVWPFAVTMSPKPGMAGVPVSGSRWRQVAVVALAANAGVSLPRIRKAPRVSTGSAVTENVPGSERKQEEAKNIDSRWVSEAASHHAEANGSRTTAANTQPRMTCSTSNTSPCGVPGSCSAQLRIARYRFSDVERDVGLLITIISVTRNAPPSGRRSISCRLAIRDRFGDGLIDGDLVFRSGLSKVETQAFAGVMNSLMICTGGKIN